MGININIYKTIPSNKITNEKQTTNNGEGSWINMDIKNMIKNKVKLYNTMKKEYTHKYN
jgi:hypothetical protein